MSSLGGVNNRNLKLSNEFQMTPIGDYLKADVVYYNGNIYTMSDGNPNATAIAVKEGKIVYVGTDKGIKEYISAGTNTIDLRGNTVLPGLTEGHMHIEKLGTVILNMDIYLKPKADIIALVKETVRKVTPGEWIQGRGWNNIVWDEDSFPTKEDLDAIAPNNPVILTRSDSQMVWINSKALEVAGITKDSINPQGGEILKTEDGEIWGCLTATATKLITNIVPNLTVKKKREALVFAQEQLFSYGFTSAMDAGITVEQLENYKYLYNTSKLTIRTNACILLESTEGTEIEYIKNTAPSYGLYNNHLSVIATKVISDGTLGSRGAAMLEDYSDRAGFTGNLRFTDEQLYSMTKTAYDNGYQICAHAIGDRANEQVIKIYEKIMSENSREDARLRIEHFQIVTHEQQDKVMKLGILLSMQPIHATSDLLMAENRVGSVRIKYAYAWRTMLDKGATLISGSDAPVELVNPYHGMYAAVTRVTRAGYPDGGWYSEQCMTREEALKSFTLWAAYGQFDEKLRGSLEIGKLADFVVIDRDYMTCLINDIKDIPALMTVSGGKVVYKRDNHVITVILQGKPINFVTVPVIKVGRVFTDATFMALSIGAKITYNNADKTATFMLGDDTVTVPTKMENNKKMVKVCVLMEALGYTVNWYQNSRTISIS